MIRRFGQSRASEPKYLQFSNLRVFLKKASSKSLTSTNHQVLFPRAVLEVTAPINPGLCRQRCNASALEAGLTRTWNFWRCWDRRMSQYAPLIFWGIAYDTLQRGISRCGKPMLFKNNDLHTWWIVHRSVYSRVSAKMHEYFLGCESGLKQHEYHESQHL